MEEREKRKREKLNEREFRILEVLRDVDHGEVRIVVNAGRPVWVEEIRKSFMLK